MLRFLFLVVFFSVLAFALAAILLALTKHSDDQYWNDIKKYYDEENNNESQG